MSDYIILDRENTTDLEIGVNKFIDLGYIPIGSIFYDGKKFYQIGSIFYDGKKFYQTMIKKGLRND